MGDQCISITAPPERFFQKQPQIPPDPLVLAGINRDRLHNEGHGFSSGRSPTHLSLHEHAELCHYYHNLCLRYYYSIAALSPAPGAVHSQEVRLIASKQRDAFPEGFMRRAVRAVYDKQVDDFHGFAVEMPGDTTRLFLLLISTCDPSSFNWRVTLFLYAGLQAILNAMIRPLGFEVLPDGLYLLNPIIQDTFRENRRRRKGANFVQTPIDWVKTYLDDRITVVERDQCRFKLSNDPRKVWRFLGLDLYRFHDGFVDTQEVCNWLAKSHLFRRSSFRLHMFTPEDITPSKHPLLSRFFTEWLPEIPWDTTPLPNRYQLGRQALLTFGKCYECFQQLCEFQCRWMWQRISDSLPKIGRIQATKALKALLYWDESQASLALHTKEQRQRDRKAGREKRYIPLKIALDRRMVEKTVLPWVAEHWREALTLSKLSTVGRT